MFLLPLPGLSEIGVDEGLTRSVQAEVGGSYDLPASLHLELQGFYHYYNGLLLPELIEDGAVPENPPLSDVRAYGIEVFLRRDEDKSFKRGDAPAQRLLKAPGHGFAFAARP